MSDAIKVIARLKNGEKQTYNVTNVASFEEARQGVLSQVKDAQCAIALVPQPKLVEVCKEAA